MDENEVSTILRQVEDIEGKLCLLEAKQRAAAERHLKEANDLLEIKCYMKKLARTTRGALAAYRELSDAQVRVEDVAPEGEAEEVEAVEAVEAVVEVTPPAAIRWDKSYWPDRALGIKKCDTRGVILAVGTNPAGTKVNLDHICIALGMYPSPKNRLKVKRVLSNAVLQGGYFYREVTGSKASQYVVWFTPLGVMAHHWLLLHPNKHTVRRGLRDRVAGVAGVVDVGAPVDGGVVGVVEGANGAPTVTESGHGG